MSNTDLSPPPALIADSLSWLAPVGVLALGTFAMGTDSFVLAGILPQIAGGLGVSEGAAGQVVTAFALAYGLSAPLLAAATAAVPRKLLLGLALCLFAAANLASAAAASLPLLLASRVLAGLCAALFTPTAYAAAAALAGPAHRGRAMSIILGGLTVGTVFGVPVGTALGQHVGWRASMVFVAAIAALALLAVLAGLPRLPLPPAVALRRRLALLADRRILAVVGVTLLATAGGILVYTYSAGILDETAGISGAGLALALLVWGIAGSIGAFGSGWSTDRLGASKTVVLAVLLVVGALLGLGLARGPALTLPLMAVFGLAGWAVATPNNHRLATLAPAAPSVAISFNSSGSYVGQALGAAIGGGLVGQHVGATGLCLAGAALAAAALVLQGFTMRSPARQE